MLLLYNVIRGALLYETKRLEHEETVKGVASEFSFERKTWISFFYKWMWLLVSFSLILLGIHTLHFLNKGIWIFMD